MSKMTVRFSDKVLSVFLAVLMIISVVPTTAFASSSSILTTDIDEKTFKVGTATVFTFSTTANDDAGTLVKGAFEFSDDTAVERLEYLETNGTDAGKWFEFYGDFGPSTGFPMIDGTSTFRVTFKKAGNYSLIVSMKSVDNDAVLCSVQKEITVEDKTQCTMQSDIGEKTFVVGEYQEFEFSTTANDFAGEMVVGTAEFSDPTAIESIQYYEVMDGNWYDLNGDFGPSSGFPLGDVASKFRVKFKTAGDYSVVASMKYATGDKAGTVLCSTGTINVHVKDLYTVTLPSVDGGTVSIDNEGMVFEEGTDINLNVVPDSDHYISNVTINDVAQQIADPTNFNTIITVNSDIDIKVEFVEIYTIVVEYDSTKGDVSTVPDCVGGSVTVVNGTKVLITATPNDTYRVLKVEISDYSVEEFTENIYDKNNPYEKELEADRDYNVIITFAPLFYNVTVNSPANGTVSVSDTPVNYGSESTVTITPDDGYCVDTVVVGEDDFYGNLEEVESSDSVLTVKIPNIIKDTNVNVTFKKIAAAKDDDYLWNSDDCLRANSDSAEYVFNPKTDVVFLTEKEGIRLTYSDGTTAGSKQTKSITINSDKTIAKIEIRYDHAWHIADVGNIKISFDSRKPVVDVKAEEANAHGYYNSDVEILVSAMDSDEYSGLESVEYWVECDGEETLPKEEIYLHDNASGINAEIKDEQIIVSAIDNNSSNVVVYIQATDRAGNKSEVFEIPLKICATVPVVEITFDDEVNYEEYKDKHSESVSPWYRFNRKATITITDRADVFDATAATNGFNFSENTEKSISISDWKSEGNTHTATVEFTNEGTYEWYYSYANKADNIAQVSKTYSFKQDRTAPDGVIVAYSDAWDGTGFDWNLLLEKITFGLYSNKEISVGLKDNKGSDNLSGFQNVTYYKSNSDEVLKESELINLNEEKKFTSDRIIVSSDEQFAVYARILDNAGNVRYIGTNGVIYDVTISEITFDIIDTPNDNAIYGVDNITTYSVNGNNVKGIKIGVSVKEANADNEYYSGIKTISYRVLMGSNVTQSDKLFESQSGSNPSKKDLQREWNGEVIIDAEKNNGKNVVLEVTVIDNAGNESRNSVTLKEINIDELTAIVGVSGSAVTLTDGYGWYNEKRTASIIIKDRASCFDEEAATKAIKITAKNASGQVIELSESDVVFGKWTNNDDMHSINVDFVANGNYNWSIEYTNKASNTLKADSIKSGESESPYEFTVDNEVPSGSVKVGANVWINKIVNILTFGLYSKSAPAVSSTADDIFSPVKLEYYKTDASEVLTYTQLDALYNDVNAENFSTEIPVISGEQQFTVYMRVTDNAGNYIYVSSDGFVVDSTQTELAIEAVDSANENNIYGIDNVNDYTVNGEDVKGIKVAISAKEAEYATDSYSGIKSITYEVKSLVENEVKVTQSGTLYDFVYVRDDVDNSNGGNLTITDVNNSAETVLSGNVPEKDDLCREWSGCIVVDANKNNSCKTWVTVTVTDNAENVKTEDIELDIDITEPVVDVTFDNNVMLNEKYRNSPCTATVVFTERDHHFEQDVAQSNIKITAKDAAGNDIKDAYSISWTKDVSSANPDSNTFTAIIRFEKDANYTFAIEDSNDSNASYVDLAGNKTARIYKEFTVDTADPEGMVTINNNKWTTFLNVITFGLYDKQKASVSVEASDATSPVKIEYAVATGESDNVNVLEFAEYTGAFEFTSDKQFDVYAKITDYAGHEIIINSDGYIVDVNAAGLEVTIVDAANDNGIYGLQNIKTYNVDNKDVKGIKINIDTKENGDTYSGINEIKYEVTAELNGKITKTQSETLYKFDYVRDEGVNSNGGELTITDVNAETVRKKGYVPAKDDLLNSWNGDIIVDAAKNNSSNVTVKVTVIDNAGNVVEKSVNLDIDINTPTIDIEYDNNTSKNDKYFDASRKATIVIVERSNHFNSTAATDGIVITAKDAAGNTVEDAYRIIGWTTTENGTNPDNAKHTAVVEFNKDANYTFEISYTGKSGNANSEVKFEKGTVASSEFTVDTVAPEEAEISINDRVWSKIIKVLTFGLYSNTKADVVITAGDVTSPVIIEYYKTNDPIVKTESFLDEQEFVPYEKFTVNSDEQFVVYVKVTDYAGNYRYISSDGYIVDQTKADVQLTVDEPNTNNIYNGDINVKVDVADVAPYSGIAKIEYWVVCDDKETQRQTLYSFDYTREEGENTNNGKLVIKDWATGTEEILNYEGNVPTQKQLKQAWQGSFTINSKLNNSCNVKVYVGVTDNAGNYMECSQNLDIDITAPSIEVTYNDTYNEGAVEGYFTARTATVKITERTHHFNQSKATDGIVIAAVDAEGKEVNGAYSISAWSTEEGKTPDEAVHTAVITYVADANYTFEVSYTDNADNKNKNVDVTNQLTPYKFTVDAKAPTGSITAVSENTDKSSRTETWTSLVENLVFGFWSNKTIVISATSKDETSPVMKVEYYMPVSEKATDSTIALTFAELDAITEWKSFENFDVNSNTQFTVYLKITDFAGNYDYISTNGLLIDDQHPLDESVAPEISVSPVKPVNGIYNDDVKVSITVTDPMVNGTYSGLKDVTYAVFDRNSETPDVPTQQGELFKFTMENPKQSDLIQSITKEIVVKADKNNSNDIQIVVYATDNSLNYIDNSQLNAQSYCVIKIDTTAPIIDITYNNNNVDSGSFFNADRTATIKVTERNFNSDDVVVDITNTDGIIPVISRWKTTNGTYNMDDTVHTATITYNVDGDYTFKLNYTDLAGLECKSVNYANSMAPTEFSIDKTAPVVTVTYDNNNVVNTNYYDAGRTATILIDEHNFSEGRINISLTATDDGVSTTVPTVNGWKTEGDKHTATIKYPGDALYTFDIDYKDLAGNNSAEYLGDTFYVDNTDPIIEFANVIDMQPYGDVINPIVTCTDTNYDSNSIKITLSGANRGVVSLVGNYSDVHNGKQFNFADFARTEDVDDIYTLTASIADMAGRVVSNTINFSVNRFGSVYALDDSTKKLNNAHVKDASDVVIREVNATALSNIRITLFKNSEIIALKDGADYKVSVNGGNGKWYEYVYTIFKSNFADDGVYRLSVYSEDAAGNIAENTLDTKNTEIGFVVDKTVPTINIKNLVKGETYPVDNYDVLFAAADNLQLTKLTVYLDSKEYASWTGETLESIINSGDDFIFNISGDSNDAHTVKVVAVDAAGNVYEKEIDDFYVTTNIWVRYYNNKPLFYGSIAGVIVLAALIVFLVVYKRRKNENKKK